MQYKVLLIEDEDRMRKVLSLVLASHGYEIRSACDGKEGMSLWREFNPDLVFTDLKMPQAGGMEVLQFGNTYYKDTPVIILTAFGTIPDAVDAMKKGAFDYITKPVDNDVIIDKAKAALRSRENSSQTKAETILFGESMAMARVKKEIELVSGTNTSVLITGESGTGKEIAARTIHSFSSRASSPMVKINCSAIPSELMESELFGHKKGAFTGATQDRVGAFVRAGNGTLFLDEIGDLPLALQPKLLHAVEDKKITPVGGTEPVDANVKIISATNQDLGQMVKKKSFRSDLYYRLNTYAIDMPPLRERIEDMPELANHFLEQICRDFDCPAITLDGDCLDLLQQYGWPGNVRELKNVLERMMLFSRDREITPALIKDLIDKNGEAAPTASDPGKAKDLFAAEREMIVDALQRCGWNRSKAARYLGITRNTLRYRIKKYTIEP